MTTQGIKISIREPIEHDLKIYSRHFEDMLSGKKKAEQRVNDRDFQVGDTLLLREVTESELRYTGRKLYVTITHITRGDGYDILSIEPQDTVCQSEISVHPALMACAEILETFHKREVKPQDTVEDKLEQWQACYAFLFQRMNDLLVNAKPEPVSSDRMREALKYIDEAIAPLVNNAGLSHRGISERAKIIKIAARRAYVD